MSPTHPVRNSKDEKLGGKISKIEINELHLVETYRIPIEV